MGYNNTDQRAVTVEITRITPSLASEWLQHNRHNRHVTKSHVADLARALIAGEGMLTGESIKFDWHGDLLDGQHRLQAIVQSKKPLQCIVVKNLDPEVRYIIDTGKKRTAADALEFDGHPSNSSTTAAAARIAITWDSGHRYISSGWPFRITNAQVVGYVNAHPELESCTLSGRRFASKTPLTPGVSTFALYQLTALDHEAALEFFERIKELRTNGTGDPVNSLIRRYQYAKQHRETLNYTHHLFILFRAWNAVRRGETLGRIIVPDNGGSIPDPL